MRAAAFRLMLPLAVLIAGSGCIAHHHGYGYEQRYPANDGYSSGYGSSHSTVIEYRYASGHPLPDHDGGGWCPHDSRHVHGYQPSYSEHFVYDSGSYHYRGPVVVWYLGGHLDAHGGSCGNHGRHWHDYAPRGHGHHYDRGRGGYVWNNNGRHDANPVVSRPGGNVRPPVWATPARPVTPPGQGTGRGLPPGWGSRPDRDDDDSGRGNGNGHGKGNGNGYGHRNHDEDHPGKGRGHDKYDGQAERERPWARGNNGDRNANDPWSNTRGMNSSAAERRDEQPSGRSIWGDSHPGKARATPAPAPHQDFGRGRSVELPSPPPQVRSARGFGGGSSQASPPSARPAPRSNRGSSHAAPPSVRPTPSFGAPSQTPPRAQKSVKSNDASSSSSSRVRAAPAAPPRPSYGRPGNRPEAAGPRRGR